MMYIEKIIARKVIDALVAANPFETITVSGESGYDYNRTFKHDEATKDDIIAEMDQYDECHVFVGGDEKDGFGPFVYFIFGNGNCGWDVISDYSTSLEDMLKPVIDFCTSEGKDG